MKPKHSRRVRALALGVTQAHAFGLGQLTVRSGLDEPLVAEIPIISGPGETENVDVRLASPEAFARVGLESPTRLAANLEFAVVESGGRQVIRVTTEEKVSEPFLSFLLEVDWGNGRVVREFTALLDPPYIAPATLRPATQGPVASATPARPVPQAGTAVVDAAPAQAEPLPAAAQPRPAAAAQVQDGNFGPVGAGQTLSEVASAVRPQGVSLNQMMAALHAANPDAFIGGNINLIKRGAVLRIPAREEVDRLGRAEADALVRQQTESWQQRIAPVPQPAVAEAATPAGADEPAADPAAAAPGEDDALAAAGDDDARLEIVPMSGDDGGADDAQTGAAGGGTGTELRAELGQAREDLAARETEAQELRSRVSDLESLREQQARLIEVQNSKLAALQARLGELDEGGAGAGVEGGTTVVAAADAAAPAAAGAPAAPARWPWILAGLVLLLAGIVAVLRYRRQREVSETRLYGGLAAEIEAAQAARAAQRAPRGEDDAFAAAAGEVPDADAAASLRAAIAARPYDLDLHLALLRHHYDSGDAGAFERAAEAMRAEVVDVRDRRWQAALALGTVMAPMHPLFRGQEEMDAAQPVDRVEDEGDLAGVDGNDRDLHEAADALAWEPGSEFERDAELQGDAQATPDSERGDGIEAAAGWSTDERFAEVDVFAPPAEDEAVEPVDVDADARGRAAAGDAFELDADRSDPALREAAHREAGDAAGAGVDAEGAATKLELARAYLDIGDSDGARGMLEEVAEEGTSVQREEARRILAGIG
ncbi:FimV/HubP family polar landmark protein [Coralloluteibacterium stylophorae]|uniref:FimV N-terminal domain-containing protein n=1 Tax=Coralloluteibacterium stylophorae TaxID=1776034 RepID=A0AAP2CB29_9GAMM|nr:hypothetical protein [Coralloluteibacterium stylophorae]